MKKVKLLPLIGIAATVATVTPLVFALTSCSDNAINIQKYTPVGEQPTGTVTQNNAARFYFEDNKNFARNFANDWYTSLKTFKHDEATNESKEENQVDAAYIKNISVKASTSFNVYLLSFSAKISSHVLNKNGTDKDYTQSVTKYVTEYNVTELPYEITHLGKTGSVNEWAVSSIGDMSQWETYTQNWSVSEKIHTDYTYIEFVNGQQTYWCENTYNESNTANKSSMYLEGNVGILNVSSSYYMEKVNLQ